jgi:hypothetical protein
VQFDREERDVRVPLPLDATSAYVIRQWLYTPGILNRRFSFDALSGVVISR